MYKIPYPDSSVYKFSNLMDIITACNLLEIDDDGKKLTMFKLKKQYHRMALLYHPDKNSNTVESKEKFQLVQEAFHVLKRELDLENGDTTNEEPSVSNDYTDILKMFINGVIQGKYNDILFSMLKNIFSGCKEIAIQLLDDVDHDTCLFIYDFFTKYKTILQVDDATFEKVQQALMKKCMDSQVYIVRPELQDLFDNNVFKLNIQEKLYYVPLWHDELYFDENIIVKCIPNLPDNIEIDEYNNIWITMKIPFTFSLLEQKEIEVSIANKQFFVPVDKLRLRKFQTHVFYEKGISIINEKNMYDIDKKANIVVKIIFV
jgi:hypothetical protein